MKDSGRSSEDAHRKRIQGLLAGTFSPSTAYLPLYLSGTEPLGDPSTPNPAALTVCENGCFGHAGSAIVQSSGRGIRLLGNTAYYRGGPSADRPCGRATLEDFTAGGTSLTIDSPVVLKGTSTVNAGTLALSAKPKTTAELAPVRAANVLGAPVLVGWRRQVVLEDGRLVLKPLGLTVFVR